MSHLRHLRFIVVIVLAGVLFVPVWGQDLEEAAPAPPVDITESVARVEALQREIEASTELSEAQRIQAIELCRSALIKLQKIVELVGQETQFTADAETVQQRYDEENAYYITGLPEKPLFAAVLPDTLPELEQALNKQQLQLAKDKKDLAEAEAEPKRRVQRRKTIRDRLIDLPGRIAEIEKQLSLPPTAEEPLLVVHARSVELEARRWALQRESLALESELAKYDAEDAVDMLRLQRDLDTLRLARTEKRVTIIEERVQAERKLAAEQAVRQARDEAIAATPVLKPYAERNQQLAETSQAITRRLEQVNFDLKEAQKARDELKLLFDNTRSKADIGLTRAVGTMLRKRAASLPDVRERRIAVAGRSGIIDELQYEQLEYEEERDELGDPEPLVQAIVVQLAPQAEESRQSLESLTRDLLNRKREYLANLLRNYRDIFNGLVDLDTTEREIISLTEEYHQYINERVLWIRSSGPLSSSFKVDRSDVWLLGSSLWIRVVRSMWEDARRLAPLYLAVISISLALIFKGQTFRQELRDIAETIARPGFYSFAPTLRAVGLTAAIAAAWPGLLGFLAWRLSLVNDGDTLPRAVGLGLVSAVALWFPLELLRQICCLRGLGAAHFGWSDSAMELLRQHLRWLIVLGLPLTFVTVALAAGDRSHGRDALERSTFIITMFVFAVFLRRVLHPKFGLFREYLAYHRNGWIDRLQEVWYWTGVASPLALAGLAFWGYYYTAQVLTWRLYATICFTVAVVLVRSLLMRLMMLRRRKLSIEQARQRAAAASQAGEAPAASAAAGIVTAPDVASLSDHNAQAQSFLSTIFFVATVVGLWWIWVPVLPALGMLDQWRLWPKSVAAAASQMPPVSVPGAAGAINSMMPTPTPSTKDVGIDGAYVTFADLALAILVAVITVMCARNVPGMLELSVLQRLPLEPSVRYAITSLTSYAIVLIGVVVSCSTIGLRWAQVQWLATALTFGLAFGLQEMFANFVAGVILLFERPIRVGDIVTVDDVSGVVSKIRIRATSITNWDRKEYVVPNKEFITGRLLNWTLSDQVNRIVVNVGVAYGSDTALVRQLLLKAAQEHPLTLDDPAPVATFEGFGDNSLNFVLRTFLPNLEKRLEVIHDLHMTIDSLFRKAGIEIAFPQRDLHIRTAPPALSAALLGESTLRVDQPHRQPERGPHIAPATGTWGAGFVAQSGASAS